MKATFDVLMAPLGVWLRLIAMLLLPVQLWLWLRARGQKRRLARRLFALHALFGLCLLTLLLDGAYRVTYLDYTRSYLAPVRRFCDLPWAVIAALEAASAVCCVLAGRGVSAYERDHPSANAVKQTVDLLPAGICVAGEDGQILLSNLNMNACNLALTGSVYTDAVTLWEAAAARGEAQEGKLLVSLPDGTTLLMERSAFEQDGRQLRQLTAEDVTEQYRMTEELTGKNARLRELQQRLKDYRRRETELVIRQELLAARTTIHNQLGGALLTGKYHLEHPDSADPETLRLLLRHINDYLLSEAEEPERGADPYESALQTAAGFGVAVQVTGTPPEGALRALLGQAIAECAANAVKHAGGDRLEVTAGEDGFTVVNNGAPPEKEIRPTGGLRSLRLSAEQLGYRVTLESSPRFRLTVGA